MALWTTPMNIMGTGSGRNAGFTSGTVGQAWLEENQQLLWGLGLGVGATLLAGWMMGGRLMGGRRQQRRRRRAAAGRKRRRSTGKRRRRSTGKRRRRRSTGKRRRRRRR